MFVIGNHVTLMKSKGVYHGLVEAQNLRLKKDEEGLDVDEEDLLTGIMTLHFVYFRSL